ncbi:MAG: PEP/pyruvate-binding domain-containing protein [Carbonactinosporaceae bacterium]
MRSSSAADDAASRLRSLDDAEATRPGAVGAKAAALARARQAGLPVVAGYVVPVAEGHDAMRAGREARERSGDAAARRASLGVQVDAALGEELRTAVERLGGRVVVRSSSPLENDHRWSGAFSSLNEIGPDDAAVAVRSCWASVFGVDPLERAERCGVDPAHAGMGVLVQRELAPSAGGVARVEGDAVQVTGVEGHPGALLGGWAEGASARIGPSAPNGTALTDLVGEATVSRVVDLARTVYEKLGDDAIEWASAADRTYLLQTSLTAVPASHATARPPNGSAALRRPCALTFARLLDRFPSAAAARYLLPWAGGTPGADGSPPGGGLPAADLQGLYRSAMRCAWGGEPERQRAAEEAVDLLAGADPDEALLCLSSAAPVDPAVARAVTQALESHGPTPGSGLDHRWSPFVASVVLAHGRRVAGTTCVPGVAVGRLWHARPHAPAPQGSGYILVCERPLPALAPLLFGAQGVVVLGGPADSHLGEVARSLGVPMLGSARLTRVTGPLDRLNVRPGWLAAVDASRGELAVVPRVGWLPQLAHH